MPKVRHPDPPPLPTNDVAAVGVGTAVWALALIVLAPMHARLERAGHLWWIAAAACGLGLGLLGLVAVNRRRRRQAPRSRRGQG